MVGSQTPWLEAMALAAGAAHVTALDYVKIESQHPMVKDYELRRQSLSPAGLDFILMYLIHLTALFTLF